MTTIMVGKNYRIEQCMKCRHCDDFIECKHYEKTGTKCEYYEFPINNSKWSFIRLFSFKGRIGRAEMWLTFWGCFISAILVNIYFVENAISTLDEIGRPYYISELAKERIRRAGEKIKADSPLTTAGLDVGFRVLKLADSNMKDVYYAADELDQQTLADMVSNIKGNL